MTIKKILQLALILATVFVASTTVAHAQNEKTISNIVLNKTGSQPLTIQPKKTEIVLGISNADMAEFNQNPTPENIKRFMATIAPEYGVDWKLVYAIGYHESGNYGSSLAQRNNNYFGRKATSGGYASWATPEEGIRNQFEYLKTRYFERGMDTPAKINPVYAEDSSWHYKVEAVMASL